MVPDFSKAEKFILDHLGEKLSPVLTYHGKHHTLDLLDAAMRIAATENISDFELGLLRVACCFHDAGFIYLYKGHEQKSCEMAMEYLPQFNFSEGDIKLICGMIMATQIPQQPHTLLERIIADADLDYLGREDFYPISNNLFKEMKEYNFITSEEEWNRVQVNFFKSHHFHTPFGINVRNPEKEKRLKEIEAICLTYE